MVPETVPLLTPVERADWLMDEGSRGAEVDPMELKVPGRVPLGIPADRADWLSEAGSVLVLVGTGNGESPGNE